MGDLTEAGRWYFLCESADPAAKDCVLRFKRRHGFVPKAILSGLPGAIVARVQQGRGTHAVSKRRHAPQPEAEHDVCRGRAKVLAYAIKV